MTEPADSEPNTAEIPRSARELLLDWANQQDGWVRAIVGEVVSTRRELSPAAVTIAKDRYLVEKQLEANPAPMPPVAGPMGEVDEAGDALRLVALRDCYGVNALAENQEIIFHPRMTVLFGENAMGKTGYVRVLKQLAHVRSAEPIIPDIHRPSASTGPRATIRYALGAAEQEVTWQGEAGLAPFTRMTIFDSPAVALHLEGSVTYVFTPADLALFRYTHGAIEAVRAQLEGEAALRQPGQNPFLTAFMRGTPVYAEIEALGASTDLARLIRLARVSDAERATLDSLRTSVEALENAGSAGRSDLVRARSVALKHLVTLAEAIENFERRSYDEAITLESQTRDAQARAAEAMYADGQLPTELRPVWQGFIEAGERYLAASGKTDYPEIDDECVYCRQKLDEAAQTLLREYRDYASGAGAEAMTAAHTSLVELAAPLQSPEVEAAFEALGTMLTGLEDSRTPPEWISDGRHLFDQTSSVRDAILQGMPSPTPAPATLTQALLPHLRASSKEAAATLTALEGDTRKQAVVLADDQTRVAALEARLVLARLMPEIRDHVERAAWVHRLRTLLTRFPGLLRSLTETSKVASQEILNRDFERVFYEECARLRAPTVTLDFPGRRGEASRRKSVTSDHTLAAILSQGEQKVIAIADFLAEASLRTGSAPIVFDDPVDSFDHRRVGEIAKRIADLSDNQQVVVFTHDIMFAANLISHFDNRPSECTYYQVTEDGGHKGVVSRATHARLDSLSSIKSRVNESIQAAQGADPGDRQERIDAAYDHIRAWCEVGVETKLLARVTQRYQPNVAMQQLELIRIDRLGAAIGAIYPIWEKSNRYIPAHSQPLVTLGVRPTLDELRVDWATLQQALRDYDAV